MEADHSEIVLPGSPEHGGSSEICRADRYLVFGAPYIGSEEIAEVVDTLRSGWIGTGPRVAAFERGFALYKGSRHAVAVNSGTAALHLSLLAAGIGPGDEVITTAMTFCATVNAIVHTGATPVIVDCQSDTMNIDPRLVSASVTSRTRAVLPVHFAGRACDMDAIQQIASRHGLAVIEDCAHAVETTYKGRPSGTLGDFGCFSFYVTKNVMTGEGGMVLTSDPANAARLKTLALHGMSTDAWKRFSDDGYKHYDVVECGFKYNMMDLQAALGIHQLRRVRTAAVRRNEIWDVYTRELAGLPITMPAADADDQSVHAHHLFPVLVDSDAGISRDEVIRAFHARGIGLGVHYRSIPEHPYYQNRFGWRPDGFPCASDIGRRTVSLPLSAGMTDRDIQRVIDAAHAVFAAGRTSLEGVRDESGHRLGASGSGSNVGALSANA